MINKEDFFKVKRKIEKVDVPALGGHVYVLQMTAQERDDYEALLYANTDNMGSRAIMVRCTACHEDGTLIFGNDDIEKLKEIPASILQPVFNKAVDLASFSKKDIEELEKK